MVVTPASWTPSSWRGRPTRHRPEWPDETRAAAALAQLKAMPPLVFAG
ncbi:MAG: 3-deoxy-7-phosphoheptulonate synthase, partial [Actinobacteria bacterium]|nr:3-deoxy-7-phosphoheptulonate synthase [Actinomycetota bacterium]